MENRREHRTTVTLGARAITLCSCSTSSVTARALCSVQGTYIGGKLLELLFTSDGRPREGLEAEAFLSSADVAALFQMTERSIRKPKAVAAAGQLPHRRTLGGGRLLYPAHEIALLYAQSYRHCEPPTGIGKEGWHETA